MDQELGRYCHPFSLCAHDLHGAPAHRLRSGQRPNPTLAGRKGGLLCIDSTACQIPSFQGLRAETFAYPIRVKPETVIFCWNAPASPCSAFCVKEGTLAELL